MYKFAVFQTKVGWVYEFAAEATQQYKEGKFILERALIQEYDGSFNGIFAEPSTSQLG